MRYAASCHFADGKFENSSHTSMDMSFKSIMSLIGEQIKGVPNKRPKEELPMKKSPNFFDAAETSLMWFGHSAFALKLDGKNILLDPMLGKVPAPHPLLGGNRYNSTLPMEIEEMPAIDLVIISHDHYDHLDYESISKLASKTAFFAVPLGVGAHLKSWGIEENKIKEFNWWDEFEYQDLHWLLLHRGIFQVGDLPTGQAHCGALG